MSNTVFPECRHRGAQVAAGAARCHSPRLAGDQPVTPSLCQSCYCRDHPVTGGAALPVLDRNPAPWDVSPRMSVARLLELLDGPALAWPPGWESWGVTAEAHRAAFDRAVARAEPCPQGLAGRGIVFSAGGWRFFASLYVSVRVLRHVGCRLPIQVWYLGDRGEFDPRMECILRAWQVEWVDADAYVRRERIACRILGGWELKPFATLHCPFEEVLLLDADNYPVCDPEYLFECRPYREHGAVFWPDLPGEVLSSEQWARWGLPYRDEPAFESGQVLIDKRRCWDALRLTVWLNDHSDYTYRHIYGDKDTFHIGWARADRSYAMAPPCVWSVHTFLQHDFDGRVVFQHRARDKFRLGRPAYMTSQSFAEPTRHPNLAHEEFCFACLAEAATAVRRSHSLEYWLLPFLPERGDVFLDIGANKGSYSRELACNFRRVLAFEPNPDLFEGLRASMPANVTVYPLGLWSEDGEREFSVFTRSDHFTAMDAEWIDRGPELGKQRVLCRTLDGLSQHIEGRVEFVKVDTEAAEVEVIRGAERVIRRDRPRLLIEFHTAENRTWLERVLGEWGYRLEHIVHAGYPADSPLHLVHGWLVGTFVG